MEKELYYTNNKLILKFNIYFDLSPCQFNDMKTDMASLLPITRLFPKPVFWGKVHYLSTFCDAVVRLEPFPSRTVSEHRNLRNQF